jgi:hypothetical protein
LNCFNNIARKRIQATRDSNRIWPLFQAARDWQFGWNRLFRQKSQRFAQWCLVSPEYFGDPLDIAQSVDPDLEQARSASLVLTGRPVTGIEVRQICGN